MRACPPPRERPRRRWPPRPAGARTRAPARSGVGWVGSSFVPMRRPRLAGGRRRGAERVEVEGPVPPDDGGVDRPCVGDDDAPLVERLAHAGAGQHAARPARARADRRRRGPTRPGRPLRRRCRSSEGDRSARPWSAPSCWWRRRPGRHGRAARPTAPAASPMAWPVSQITPSRSTIHIRASAKCVRPLRSCGRGAAHSAADRRRSERCRRAICVDRPRRGRRTGGGWRPPADRPTRGPGGSSSGRRRWTSPPARRSARGRQPVRGVRHPPAPCGRALKSAMRSPATLAARSQ